MTYTIINQKKLGSGSYGDVYVLEDELGKKIAVKIIDPKKLSYVELDILTRLKSPYIIRSVGDPIIQVQNSQGITLQLKDNCISRLDTRNLPYYQLKKIMLCCLFGLRCMHSKGYLHNDLVLRNILYDKDKDGDYVAYLADFSVSVKCLDAKKGIKVSSIVRGTHTPLEILEGIKSRKKTFYYNDKTDIWSLGLCFLELIDRRLNFSSDSEQIDFYHSLDQDFIRTKIKRYGTKISKKEQIYLTELLINMLQKNQKDRMGSDDLMYLNFVKTSSISYDCSLNKPSELMVLPAVNSETKKGIKMIRNFFDQNREKRLSAYFLSLQILIRIMNKIILETEKKYNLKEIVNISLKTALNYYDRSVEAGYEGGILLRGEVGYNPYFYGASYLEELRLIDYYLDHDAFVSQYNIVNPYDIFSQLRLMYSYEDENKVTNNVTYDDFKEISFPDKKEKERKIFLPSDYSNVSESGKTDSKISREKKVEEVFSGILVDYTKKQINDRFSHDYPDIVQMAMDYTEGGSGIKNREIYKLIKERDIFSTLVGINKFFTYGIIKVDNGNLVKNIYNDRKFVVVSSERKISLLYVEPDEKIVTHYYSQPISSVRQLYEDNGYEYKTNFVYGINNCCRVVDSCVMFIIFYNNYLDLEKPEFELKCVSEQTNFIIFLSMFIDQN